MAVGFPPQPVFPNGIDSDYTLFLVYNTTESALAEDNEPWSEEIEIIPRSSSEPEVWADNGFGNINGELFYYDTVEKDSNGKVKKLRRCARNLAGSQTQFNYTGDMVRGFVVAEHHNQLVDAIILTQQFIGEDLTEDEGTLDWRIRNLNEVPIIFDDFGCPDIQFFFETTDTDPSAGTTIHYRFEVTGTFSEFKLDFGDGQSTASIQEDDHIYPPNATIDPIATFKTDRCQIVQTPIARNVVNAAEPTEPTVTFDIPNFPDFVFPNITINPPSIPETNLTLPPTQFPCFDLTGLGISSFNIPSIIEVQPPINLPSFIEFEDISIPSVIGGINIQIPSILNIVVPDISVVVPDIEVTISIPNITFPDISIDVPTFPVISLIVPNISVNIPNINVSIASPPALSVAWGSPPTLPVTWGAPPALPITWGSPPNVPITWTPVPTLPITWGTPPAVSLNWGTPPAVSLNWGSPPTVNVNWGSPPTLSVNINVVCPSTPSMPLALTDPGFTNDMMGLGKDMEVAYEFTGFPSEIKMIAPTIPDVRITHDIPSEINVRSHFPDIKFEIPEFKDIKIVPPETQLTIEAVGFPEFIELRSNVKIPERIEIFTEVKIPEKIFIDASDIPDVIRIEGLTDVIRIEHDLPKTIGIELKMPEKPEIELVYKGSPIPVQVELNMQKLLGDMENVTCYAITPCRK